MSTYISLSEDETRKFATEFARQTNSKIFALTGELGAGKTVFAQGFAKGLGIKEKIISPSFVLIRQYKIPDISKIFYHIDLYRLENIPDDLHSEIAEIIAKPEDIVMIEWAEKLKDLPKKAVKIEIQIEELNKRKFIIHNS